MTCPACGTPARQGARFCTQCGSRLVSPSASAAAPSGKAASDAQGPSASAKPVDPRAVDPRAVDPRAVDPRAVDPRATPRFRASIGAIFDRRYRLMRKLGEGGMSIVYLAEDMEESGRYAVKVLSPSLTADENAMARLRREAALGMQLEHPNVCHIVRLGDAEDGTVYAVMPFIEGELLADRRHRLGVLPLRDVVPWVSDIAAGLDRAHRLGIVHRDLKPENVMITHTAPEARERAVVMDFGLAKAQRAGAELERLTSTGIILGTPEFMSPEQLRGKPVDARTDVYALALIVYELLTGRLPFAGRTQQEMMIARLRSEPTPLRQQRPDLGFSEAVERVLARGMARESEKRYQSAPEMAQALEAATGESA